MKLLVFIITIFAYTTVHIMRMALPFVQNELIIFFGVSKQIMGLAMASTYLLLSIAYFYRIFVPHKNVQKAYFEGVIMIVIFYTILPLAIVMNIHHPFFLFLSLAGFGIFQSSSWPTLIKITGKFFKPETDGCLLGIWSSSKDMGKVLGFFLCTVIIFYLKLPWYICLFVASFFATVFGVGVYLLPLENPQELETQEFDENHRTELCSQYSRALKDPITICTLILLCLLKSLIYGIVLWLPMYFAQGGFGEFSGYILMAMSIFAIIGSLCLGNIYEKVQSRIIRSIIFVITQAILVIGFYSLKHIELDLQNKWIFFFLIAIIGFNLQGNFNCIMTHESIMLSQRQGIQISSVSSLFECLGNFSVGLVQIIIGISVQRSTDSIFTIFMILSVLSLGIYFMQSFFVWKLHHNQNAKQGSQEIRQQEEIWENQETD